MEMTQARIRTHTPMSRRNTAKEDFRLRSEVASLSLLPTDMPRAALIEVEECPAPKQSYSDSFLLVKPERPAQTRSGDAGRH